MTPNTKLEIFVDFVTFMTDKRLLRVELKQL